MEEIMPVDFLKDFLDGFSDQWIYLIRVVFACLCGGAIGIERTLRQKDAGFRTHTIVALGAALIMVISKYGFFDLMEAFPGTESFRVDASRIASNVITGVSFLGAGMIFANGSSIKGLTTAAGIWATAAVGMAIGAGLYMTGVITTLLVIVIQIVFHTFLIGFDRVLANDISHDMVVRITQSPEAINRFKEALAKQAITVVSTNVTADKDSFVLVMSVKSNKHTDLEKVSAILMEEKDVISVSM